ncbi:CHAT domain protein [Brevundimonas sp. SH203]|uniref:CHAT domain-containing protein n=1 Tax=Brevundimonas sp. SH203 TaxID=345167 RepID=UPI0009D2D18C|nr:CHAT domain-containing protein [Brevundimonas sp. SH203]GAW40274.1 CHAT domain protein [Brevundimonas sp. SH203]
MRTGVLAVLLGLMWTCPVIAQDRSPLEIAFEDAQLAGAPGAGAALADGAARIAADDPGLRDAFEAHRAAEQTRHALETVLATLRSQGAPAAERARGVAADLDRATTAAQTARARLDSVYPAFGDLTDPTPLSVAAVQALLKPGEGLVVILPSDRATYVWAVTADSAVWRRSDMTAGDVATDAARLQAGLGGAEGRGAVDAARPARSGTGFDRAAAYRLYQALWAPVADSLSQVQTVYVVADGSLRAVPPGVLVTAAPTGDDRDPAALRATAWLQRRYAFAILPTVTSLRAVQRTVTSDSRGFAGFGDADMTAYPAGSVAKTLAPLPGAGRELRALSRAMRGGDRNLKLGAAATEAAVKSAPLSDISVVAFAMHALPVKEGGEGALREPALVFTPPAAPQGEDDGVLTASEAAQLRLKADLVILSACDTAQDDPQALGVNSLSRAFFYAGARSLLVSNWRIRDDVAERLSVRTVTLARRNRAAVADALQRASLEMLDDRSDPTFAHPAQWAAFSLLGDGAVRLVGR